MKRFAVVAFVLAALGGCEQAPSKLDSTKPAEAGAAPSGDMAARLQRVEAQLARYGEALEFLQKVYDSQKAQQAQQEASEPDPDAVFAVDIGPAVAAGQVDGPSNALVTIVEAWDFA
jgi:hypothetical protein